jgi:hypothetical protein
MSLDALRALATDFQFTSGFGGPAIDLVLTTPDIGAQPVETTGFWIRALEEDQPYGTELRRRDPRRVLVIPRSDDIPEPVRGTLILAAELEGQTEQTWEVEGFAPGPPNEPDCWRVIVMPT